MWLQGSDAAIEEHINQLSNVVGPDNKCLQVFYEFFVFRFQNKTITHALATALHFLIDAICCFVTCVFITEVTKFGAGRLRPDFLQVTTAISTPSSGIQDMRRSYEILGYHAGMSLLSRCF